MNKLFYSVSISILGIFLMIGSANAEGFVNPSYDITTVRDFDVQVLDFIIADNNGVADALQAITLKNDGTAADIEVAAVNFWADMGPDGFQGFSVDKKLGEFTRNASIAGWSISGLNELIPVGGLRVFVTIDIKSDFYPDGVFRVFPHELGDINDNGSYDFGDYGVYVESTNDGPELTVNHFIEAFVKFSFGDLLPPRLVIGNLEAAQTILPQDSLEITGFAKDRQGGGLKTLQMRIDKDDVIGDWFDINSSVDRNTMVHTWSYLWQPVVEGQYTINMKTSDHTNNLFVIEPIKVTVAQLNSGQEPVPMPVPLPIESDVSIENSTLEVNRNLGLYLPIEKSGIIAKITIKNSDNEPLIGKSVTLKGLRPGKDTPSEITVKTGLGGVALFRLTSDLATTATYTLYVDDKELSQHPSVKFVDARLDGTLIKGKGHSAVYLLRDDKRWVFPTQAIYNSYFSDFSNVVEIDDSELAQYTLGGNLGFQIGSLIKIRTVNKVYRVNQNNEINWIETEELATKMYSDNWTSKVHDVADVYFSSYTESVSIK